MVLAGTSFGLFWPHFEARGMQKGIQRTDRLSASRLHQDWAWWTHIPLNGTHVDKTP
jgi:hypothetical protein